MTAPRPETQEREPPMPDEQPILDPACEEAQAEWAVLNLLIDSDHQRPRSVEEIIRERGSRIDTLDAIDRLYGTGLIHRIGEFIFATRAAIRFSQIVG
jgi:hypothetical protein